MSSRLGRGRLARIGEELAARTAAAGLGHGVRVLVEGNVFAFELPVRIDGSVASLLDAVAGAEGVGIFAQRGDDLRARPKIERALFLVLVRFVGGRRGELRRQAVGVLRGGEPAVGPAQVALQVRDGPVQGALELRVARDEHGVGEILKQLGVVVQHLLEVRDAPLRVGRVAGEAAADLVEDPAARHGAQALDRHGASVDVAGAGMASQQEALVGGHRELGRAAEAVVLPVVRAAKGGQRFVDDLGLGIRAGLAPLRASGGDVARHLLRQARSVRLDVLAPRRPQLRDASQQLDPAGLAPARAGREVGAAEERLELRGQEDVQRPAALAGHGLDGGHVDFIDVGALLAVELHADEVLIHHVGHFLAGEALALHHVAPMARGVADGEQKGLVLVLRRLERLLAPRAPVDGIVLVLEKVRALLGREAVGTHRKAIIAKTRRAPGRRSRYRPYALPHKAGKRGARSESGASDFDKSPDGVQEPFAGARGMVRTRSQPSFVPVTMRSPSNRIRQSSMSKPKTRRSNVLSSDGTVTGKRRVPAGGPFRASAVSAAMTAR